MTVAEAARKIGVSASKLYQLVAARAIAHYKIGGKIVFSDADVDAFLTTCRIGVATPKAAPRCARLKLKHLNLP